MIALAKDFSQLLIKYGKVKGYIDFQAIKEKGLINA